MNYNNKIGSGMEYKEFLNIFKLKGQHFMWFLGAGTSVSAGACRLGFQPNNVKSSNWALVGHTCPTIKLNIKVQIFQTIKKR